MSVHDKTFEGNFLCLGCKMGIMGKPALQDAYRLILPIYKAIVRGLSKK